MSNTVGCALSTVNYVWKKFKNTGNVDNCPRSGRPRKTSKTQDRSLRRICLKSRKSTSKQMNAEWKKCKTHVCDRTVRNRLNEMGYLFCKAKTKPLLTKQYRLQRLRWARQHRNWGVDDWKAVIFSDESRVCVGSGDGAGRFVWRRSTEKFSEECLLRKQKFAASIMVWGCMSSRGTGKMCIVNGTVNSTVYQDILETFLIPSIEDMFGDADITFQDDNASCHRSKAVKLFLHNKDINSMSWPANSPDLNPIENLWWQLKRLVDNKSPTSKELLKTALKLSWAEISNDYCNTLVQSMPARIKAVIKTKRVPTKY